VPRVRAESLVVRLATQDRAGAIELLGQHQAREFVRQGPLRQRQGGARGAHELIGEAIRPTDRERDVAIRIPLPSEPGRKLLGAVRCSVDRACDKARTRSDARAEPLPLPLANECLRCPAACAFLLHLMHLERPVARCARLIVLDGGRERRMARLPDDGQCHPHRHRAVVGTTRPITPPARPGRPSR